MSQRLQTLSFTFQGDELEDQFLIYDLINQNNLSGRWRIIILEVETEIVILDTVQDIKRPLAKWYNANKFNVGELDSQNATWNLNFTTKRFLFSKNTRISSDFFIQRYSHAPVGNCLLNPILEHFQGLKPSFNRTMVINKILGKTTKTGKHTPGYMDIYKDGVPHGDIQKLCEELNIGITIHQPFLENPFLECKGSENCRKNFSYINNQLNHIEKIGDNLVKNSHAEIVSKEEINKYFNECIEKKIPVIYSHNKNSVKTHERYLKIDTQNQTIKDFEKSTGLDSTKFNYSNIKIKNFINNAMRYNGTVDFKNIEKLKELNTEELLKNNVFHIDQQRAYTQFKQSKFYSGFCGKLTDFRKCDNHKEKGFYHIEDLEISDPHLKFLNDKLQIFFSNQVYTDAELSFLDFYKCKYKITSGLYGVKMDFEFPEEMLEKMPDTRYNVDKPIPLYSYWTGNNGIIRDNEYYYMTGAKKYFEVLDKSEHTKFFYDKKTNTARIEEKKKFCFSNIHISAQIVAYQRLNVLEQLLELDPHKIIRVCIDGIYTYEKNPKCINKFRIKQDKLTLKNSPMGQFTTDLFYGDISKYLPKAKPRQFFRKELFIGAGGNGKTHYNLTDKGLIGVLYVAPHYKLVSSKINEYKVKGDVINGLIGGPRQDFNLRYYSTLIIDEASMILEHTKQQIFREFKGKIIFCGDLGFQLPPVITKEERIGCMEEMDDRYFDNVIHLKKNYRFLKNDPIRKLVKWCRYHIENSKRDYILKKEYPTEFMNEINLDDLKKNYKVQDLIICPMNYIKDFYTKTFKHLEKYCVLERGKNLNKNDIIFEDKKGVKKELRHGFTIHSVQGETAKDDLYIQLNPNIERLRMFYTAISRAKSINQIKFITNTKFN